MIELQYDTDDLVNHPYPADGGASYQVQLLSAVVNGVVNVKTGDIIDG